MLSRVIVSLFMVTFVAAGCAKKDEEKFRLPDEPVREADQDPVPEEVLEKGREVQARGWMEPAYSDAEADAIMNAYSFVDTKGHVPKNLLKKAILYYHRNYNLLANKDTLAVVDFSKHSRKDRFYIVNMKQFGFTGDVTLFHVSHGKGSDRNHTGYATKFSNVPNSETSSLGYYVTGETYSGKHGYSRRLDGLSKSNSLVRDRAIVIHGAGYVYDSDVRQGRSQGCLAFSMANRRQVIDTLREGTLIYAGRSRYD